MDHRGALVSAACSPHLQAQSPMPPRQLVEKGVLTVDEAISCGGNRQGLHRAYAVKSGLPTGSTPQDQRGLRGRFEGFYADPKGGQRVESGDWVDRTRWRYRFRLGVVANLKDNFEVGFRLSSSDPSAVSGRPISPNTTLRTTPPEVRVH